MRKAAYVIPLAHHQGNVMVLLGRETTNQTWSGFGGGLERLETYRQAASREAWEESLGYLGSPPRLEKQLYDWGYVENDLRKHRYFALTIEYDEKLPYYYEQTYHFIQHCGKEKLEKHCSEKDKLLWVPFSELVHTILTVDILTVNIPTADTSQNRMLITDKSILLGDTFTSDLHILFMTHKKIRQDQ